jgi:hypothetical protein
VNQSECRRLNGVDVTDIEHVLNGCREKLGKGSRGVLPDH